LIGPSRQPPGEPSHVTPVDQAFELRPQRPREDRVLEQQVIGPMRLLVEAILPQLRATCEGIARFDTEIARLCPTLPDYELFVSPRLTP
jgi:hypothetical protein